MSQPYRRPSHSRAPLACRLPDDHRIKYARAGYWDSYRVTFLSNERVIVASTETVRIPGYQARVELNQPNAVRIVLVLCHEGTHVGEWCVIDSFQR